MLRVLATFAYAFLLGLLAGTMVTRRQDVLRHWHHRTSKRSQEVLAPLYRLRSALSRLWLTYPPSSLWDNRG